MGQELKAIGLIYISVLWLILSGFWLLIVLKQMGSYAKLAKRALETEMPIMVQVSHLGFFFFFLVAKFVYFWLQYEYIWLIGVIIVITRKYLFLQ